jgi:hypothetical protein
MAALESNVSMRLVVVSPELKDSENTVIKFLRKVASSVKSVGKWRFG